MRQPNSTPLAIPISIAAITIVLLITFAAPLFINPSPAELERIIMPNGDVLVVHAVLVDPSDTYSISKGGLFPTPRRVIASQREPGITIVLSCRNPITDAWIPFDSFGRIEVEDVSGAKICGWRVDEQRAIGKNKHELYCVSIPRVNPATPIQFKVLDSSESVVATFGAPKPFKFDLNPEFASATHSARFAAGDWNLAVESVRAHFFGTLLKSAKWHPQSHLYPNLKVTHRGQELSNLHYAAYNLMFEDAYGNSARTNNNYLDRKQPLWKLKFDIARTSLFEDFKDAELNLLAEFDVQSATEPIQSGIRELSSSANSIIYIPAGKHNAIAHVEIAKPSDNARFLPRDCFAGYSTLSFGDWAARGYVGNFSYSGDSDRFEATNTLTLSDPDNAKLSASVEINGKAKSKQVNLATDSTNPIIAVVLSKDLQSQALCLVAKDQDNNRLVMHPMQHSHLQLPTYAIEPLGSTQSIRVYACFEAVQHVEMFIKPPTADLTVHQDPNAHHMFKIDAQGDGWKVVDEDVFNSKARSE